MAGELGNSIIGRGKSIISSSLHSSVCVHHVLHQLWHSCGVPYNDQ